jgi:hypothetical protein
MVQKEAGRTAKIETCAFEGALNELWLSLTKAAAAGQRRKSKTSIV